MFGLNFSNGYDEKMPEIKNNILRDGRIYTMNVQSNFDRDYSFGANLGWQYPFYPKIKHLGLLSTGYHQYYYPHNDFIHRDIHVTIIGRKVLSNSLSNSSFMLKTGWQTLNDYHNWGATAGIYYELTYKFSFGLSAGYYFNYLTYSAYFHGSIRRNISLRLSYERIDTYNFFNIGLNFSFYKSDLPLLITKKKVKNQ